MSIDTSASASSSSTHNLHDHFPKPPQWKYDVFLSFQGEGPSGTRNNFTDLLYTTLCRKGIVTFKDDQELSKGRVIYDDLMRAIENSMLFLVVFSRDYASSKWCLDGLTKIMECSRIRGMSSSSPSWESFVLPVFHEVKPKDVREQKGSFKESFLRHEQDDAVDKDKVLKWKSAMRDAGNLSGWVTSGQKWTSIVDEITSFIFNKANHHLLSLSLDIVGFDLHVRNIMAHLSKDFVCFVGIYGIGGIGKTTLADEIYRQIRHCFEGSVFLEHIRETSSKKGLVSLQKRLISKLLMEENISLDKVSDGVELIQKRLGQKKVLIILDDVDDRKQLEALAASSNWFGMGSKVIITTRDKRLLNVPGAIAYELEELNKADSLKLFCRRAFCSDLPPEDYAELSYHFVNRAKGLPLALEVFGSSLTGRTIPEWQSTLSRLATIPDETITRTLRISLDGLGEIMKEVFLWIACFFNGKSKHRVLHILSSCYGFHLDDIISLLKERSLIKESKEKLWIHELIQEMGWEVVRQESPDDPGKRSLLWRSEDIFKILKHNKGTESIKAIGSNYPMTTFKQLSAKAFLKMTNLRLLMLHDGSFCDNLTYLSIELRFIKWKGFPFESLPTSFEAAHLAEINLSNSQLKELWHGTMTIKLSHSKRLSKTPNFIGTPNLEKIILEGCLQLQEVDRSIGILEKLTLLNLKDCRRLKVLPNSICDLRSLRSLDLSGCSSLIALPQNLDSLKCCLEELKVAGTRLKQSSSSWLSCFNFLAPESSRNFVGSYIPHLSSLTSLTELDLSFCNLSDGAIPDDIGLLRSLKTLDLSGNIFTELPPCFTQLTMLDEVLFNYCKNLQYLPTLPSSISLVKAAGCHSLELLPDQLTLISSSYSALEFMDCRNLVRNCTSSDMAKKLLENYLGSPCVHYAIHKIHGMYCICIPGNSIPMWISNQSEGRFVSIDLPDPDLQDTWTGFLLCCVFVLPRQDDGTNNGGLHEISVHAVTESGSSTRGYVLQLIDCLPLESDHVWLLCASREVYRPYFGEDCKRITFEFSILLGGAVVKSCGADFVFDKQARPTQACQITQLD